LLVELARLFERLDLLLELRPAWEAVLSRDLKLCVGNSWGGTGTDEGFGLIAEMAEVGTIRKLHERNPFHLPGVRINRAKGVSLMATTLRLGFYPFRGLDASLTLSAG
jgi:hypothetical protein